jgi:hypothetical protein
MVAAGGGPVVTGSCWADLDAVHAHRPGTDDGFTAVARLTGLDRRTR